MKRQRNLLKLLDNQQCAVASNEAFLNAARQHELAVLAASSKQYGAGTSLLILSSEETIKGLLLFVQSRGLNIRDIKGMHLFFTDHTIKHQLATLISTLNGLIRPFMGLVLKMRERLHNPEKELVYTETEQALLSKNKFKIARSFSNLSQVFDWWEDANMMKNRGLYVDYSNALETPMQVSEEQYHSAERLITSFEDEIKTLIEYLNMLSSNQLKEFVRQAKAHNYKNLFESVIRGRQKQLQNQ